MYLKSSVVFKCIGDFIDGLIDVNNFLAVVYVFAYHFARTPPCLTLPKRQILDPSKLKEFADDNLRRDENERKFSRMVKNTVGKGEIVR